jgi:hypothetical protein
MSNWRAGLFVLLILTACTPTAVPTTPAVTRTTPTATATATGTPLFSDPVIALTVTPETAEATATHPPTPTIEPTPEPTQVVAAVCPERGTAVILSPFDNVDDLRSNILSYLNNGGSITNLVEQLAILNEERSTPLRVRSTGFGAEADVDGDAVAEVMLIVNFYHEPPDGITELVSVAWIMQCVGGVYEIKFQDIGGDSHGYVYLFTPILVVDVDQDGSSEVIFEWMFSTTTSEWFPLMVDWKNGQPVWYRFERDVNFLLCCPVEWKFEDLNGDGVQEIIVSGRTGATITSGADRDLIQTYQLEDNQWHIVDIELLPSNLRHQVLADGQRAFDAGNLELAAQFFEQAAHDDTLFSSDSNWSPIQDEQSFQDYPDEYQRAFALFRLMIVQIALGDTSGAENSFNELNERYPSGSRGGEFTQLAALYKAEVESGKSFGQACAAVTQFTLDTFPYLEEHIGYWGWFNMGFTNETHCPYKPE